MCPKKGTFHALYLILSYPCYSLDFYCTGCIKKVDKSEIALCFAKRLNVICFALKYIVLVLNNIE